MTKQDLIKKHSKAVDLFNKEAKKKYYRSARLRLIDRLISQYDFFINRGVYQN